MRHLNYLKYLLRHKFGVGCDEEEAREELTIKLEAR